MPRYTQNGHVRANRASQFMPFAALTGYHDLAKHQEAPLESRRIPTEEQAEDLSRTVLQIARGDMVEICYYHHKSYITKRGIIDAIEPSFYRLRLNGELIFFDDIWSIVRDPT
ncbi:hypothetical protein KPC83_03315 [Collinsella sp. zg1085]|uniref:hypothetical protein n=1 Tax=Collinsella sp. zg1085 TaxID=2844380 RepID=UPI001C0CDE80|nr:hypothetical protein [Collinsella sp. zg1085]QWT18172.1 hypothetical protein KPC83_03315 [Collinsella sp. zg1085]